MASSKVTMLELFMYGEIIYRMKYLLMMVKLRVLDVDFSVQDEMILVIVFFVFESVAFYKTDHFLVHLTTSSYIDVSKIKKFQIINLIDTYYISINIKKKEEE